MLSSFPHTLKRYGLDADVRVLLDLYRTFELGLVSNLGSLHEVARMLVCKSKRDFAPYTLAFWEHFLGIDTKVHRTLNDAVRNSPAFEHWLAQQLDTGKAEGAVNWEELVERFLNEVMDSDLPKNIVKELDARNRYLAGNLSDRGKAHDHETSQRSCFKVSAAFRLHAV